MKCGVTIPHQTRYTWLLLLSRHGWRNALRKHSWPARDRSTGVSNPRSNWHSFPEKNPERGEPGLLQRNWALIVLPCRRFVLVAVSYLSDHMSFNGSSSLFWLYWVLGCSFFQPEKRHLVRNSFSFFMVLLRHLNCWLDTSSPFMHWTLQWANPNTCLRILRHWKDLHKLTQALWEFNP